MTWTVLGPVQPQAVEVTCTNVASEIMRTLWSLLDLLENVQTCLAEFQGSICYEWQSEHNYKRRPELYIVRSVGLEDDDLGKESVEPVKEWSDS